MSMGDVCARCPGYCCVEAGYVALTQEDVARLATQVDVNQTVDFWPRREISEELEDDEVGVLKKTRDPWHGPCVFLRDGSCTIYDVRPNVCRNYEAAHCVADRFHTRLPVADRRLVFRLSKS